MRDRDGAAYTLVELARVVRDSRNPAAALPFLREAVSIQREIGHPNAIGAALTVFATVAVAVGEPVAAARLLGQCLRLKETFDMAVTLSPVFESTVASLCEAMGDAAFEVAWSEGRAMTLDQAVDYALALQGGPPPKARDPG